MSLVFVASRDLAEWEGGQENVASGRRCGRRGNISDGVNREVVFSPLTLASSGRQCEELQWMDRQPEQLCSSRHDFEARSCRIPFAMHCLVDVVSSVTSSMSCYGNRYGDTAPHACCHAKKACLAGRSGFLLHLEFYFRFIHSHFSPSVACTCQRLSVQRHSKCPRLPRSRSCDPRRWGDLSRSAPMPQILLGRSIRGFEFPTSAAALLNHDDCCATAKQHSKDGPSDSGIC